ncbi:MAG: hypothetical protein HKO68_03805 [Desulfobacterales bacterium]|nr:hypothetical protein [Desulfobacterales bacterium]
MSRGNERNDIFLNDDDRQIFLKTLGEIAERFEIDIFAYVLMGNHYHLLIRTKRANLSKAMQWLGVSYTRGFNDRHARSGHLFQGRFKSIIVQNDAYLVQLSCYIHRNPLRANSVNRLAHYRWSSYSIYAYGYQKPDWLSTELILSHFTNGERHKAYREQVQGYAKEETRLWEDLKHGMILGSQKFVDKIRRTYGMQTGHQEIPRQKKMAREFNPTSFLVEASKVLNCDLKSLKAANRVSTRDKEDRDLLIYALWKTGALTNTKIGELFGVTYSSVSHSVKSARSKLEENHRLKNNYNRIYSLVRM